MAKNDRTATIAAMRRGQRNSERFRGSLIIGVCALIAVAIVVAAAWEPVSQQISDSKYSGTKLQDIGADASVCGDVSTQDAVAYPQHVATGTTVTYATVPASYGSHWNEAGVAPADMSRKFYTVEDRPAIEALVHNLEHGYTILWYDETIADDSTAIDEIRAIGKKFPGTSNFRYKFIAAPWTADDEIESGDNSWPDGMHIAFAHWSGQGTIDATTGAEGTGVLQYCSGVSGAALKTFMQDYPYTDSPEPTAM